MANPTEHSSEDERPWRDQPFDPDAEIERRVGEYATGIDTFGIYAPNEDGSAEEESAREESVRGYDRERELSEFERSFSEEPRGRRQILERDHDDRDALYGRRGYGWPGPDTPDPRERRPARTTRGAMREAQHRLDTLADHFRNDACRVDDAQLTAMLEMSAEVLCGLSKAFRDWESADRGRIGDSG